MALTESDPAEVPAPLIATTEMGYVVPLVSPVITQDHGDVVAVQLAELLPFEAVAT